MYTAWNVFKNEWATTFDFDFQVKEELTKTSKNYFMETD